MCIQWDVIQIIFKEGNLTICNRDDPAGCNAKWHGPDTEGQMPHDLPHMYGL